MRAGIAVAMYIASLPWGGMALATTPVNETSVVPCGPKIGFVCAAAAVPGEENRRARLLQALAQGLESDDPAVRDESFYYLAKIEPFGFDPRPLHTSLKKFDELSETDRGASMIEKAEFRLGPQETRVLYYKVAIVTGRANIGRVAWIPRLVAMEGAAAEGLLELRDAIVEYYPQLDPGGQARAPLDRLLAELELRAGAQSYQDAAVVALRRLTAMPASDLGARIEESEGWREAISYVKLQLCKDAGEPGCGEFKTLMHQQGKLFRDRHPLRARSLDSTTGRLVVVEPTPDQRNILEWFQKVQ